MTFAALQHLWYRHVFWAISASKMHLQSEEPWSHAGGAYSAPADSL